jgi:hypothetical protein
MSCGDLRSLKRKACAGGKIKVNEPRGWQAVARQLK